MTSSSADSVSAYWSRQRAALATGLAGVAAGDLAAVHPSRVAVRRLRSTLRTYRDLFEASSTDGLDAELRRLAVELGEVRDREVLRGLLADWPGVDPPLREAVTDRLDVEISALLDALPPPRGSRIVDRLAAVPAPSGDATGLRTRSVRQVTKRFSRADAANPDPVRLHAVRKAVKRARYAGEVFPEDPDAQLDVARFERLQEVLGRHQDLALAAAYLRAAAADDPRLDTAGRIEAWIAELDARTAATAREAFVVAAATGTYPRTDGLVESA